MRCFTLYANGTCVVGISRYVRIGWRTNKRGELETWELNYPEAPPRHVMDLVYDAEFHDSLDQPHLINRQGDASVALVLIMFPWMTQEHFAHLWTCGRKPYQHSRVEFVCYTNLGQDDGVLVRMRQGAYLKILSQPHTNTLLWTGQFLTYGESTPENSHVPPAA